MEPQPVVTLNNAEALLRGQEQEEEEQILAELSQMVHTVLVILASCVAFDGLSEVLPPLQCSALVLAAGWMHVLRQNVRRLSRSSQIACTSPLTYGCKKTGAATRQTPAEQQPVMGQSSFKFRVWHLGLEILWLGVRI